MASDNEILKEALNEQTQPRQAAMVNSTAYYQIPHSSQPCSLVEGKTGATVHASLSGILLSKMFISVLNTNRYGDVTSGHLDR